MNVININASISRLLSAYDSGTLPVNPNIAGFNSQHTVTYVIASGKYDDDNIVNLELRISIQSDKRTGDTDDDARTNLDQLISEIIEIFHNRPLTNTKPISFENYEISPPESGKWRALLIFTIPVQIQGNYQQEIFDGPLTKIIDRRYV